MKAFSDTGSIPVGSTRKKHLLSQVLFQLSVRSERLVFRTYVKHAFGA